MPGKPGSGGPVPKTDAQRRRRHKPAVETEVAPAGPVNTDVTHEPDPQWHPIAREWFSSLAQSGQSNFFEASDWATARLVGEAMHRLMKGQRFSAQLFQSVLAGTTMLLSTEGDRRRLKIELARGEQADSDEAASVAKLNDYRDRLGG